ncbi:MAG: hypothetical protein ACREB2_09520 [Pseudolabrys sp.]
MPKNCSFWGLLALIFAISAGFLAPAAAQVSRNPREFAAQSARPRITIHPRRVPNRYSVRQCRSWLIKEYRVSGTVITPQMRCWWN